MFFNKTKKENTDKVIEKQPAFLTKFATYCRSVELVKPLEKNPSYWEAFQQSGSSELWTAREVYLEDDATGRRLLAFKTIKKNLSFLDAITKLAAFERMINEEAYTYTATAQTAEDLGDKHYIVMAEREGIVFANTGRPHLSNAQTGLPETDGRFYPEDLERAEIRRKETTNLTPLNTSRKTAEDTALTELFNNLVYKGNFEETLKALQELKIHDLFIQDLGKIRSELSSILRQDKEFFYKSHWLPSKHSCYTSKQLPSFKKFVKYEWSSKSDGFEVENMPVFYKILPHIGNAYKNLINTETDKVTQKNLNETLLFIEASVNLIYAKFLFNQALGSTNKDETTTQIRLHQKIAEDIFTKKLDLKNQENLENLKQYILQGDHVSIPSFMSDLETNYQHWRRNMIGTSKNQTFDAQALSSPPLPKIPKPEA